MDRLEQKFPDSLDLIRSGRQRNLSDGKIEEVLLSLGRKPQNRNFSFAEALAENISGNGEEGVIGKIPVIGKSLDVLLNIIDLPQDFITAMLSGGKETFYEKFARGQDPSEALGITNPIGKILTDIVLDPLTLIGAPGGAPVKAFLAARKVKKATEVFDAIKGAGKLGILRDTELIAKTLSNKTEAIERLVSESGGLISREAADKIVNFAPDVTDFLKKHIEEFTTSKFAKGSATIDEIKDATKLNIDDTLKLIERKTGIGLDREKFGLPKTESVIDSLPDEKYMPSPQEVKSRAPDRLFNVDDFTNGIPSLNKQTFKEIGDAFIKLAAEKKIEVFPTSVHRLYTQMIGAINSGKLSLKEIASKAGKKDVEILRSIIVDLEGFSDAGRYLNEAKQLYSQLRVLAKNAKGFDAESERLIKEILDKTNKIEPESAFKKFYNLFINKLWRGSLTSQLSTAMRNLEVQFGRVGLDVMQNSLDAAIQALPGITRTTKVEDVFGTVIQLFRKNKQTTKGILSLDDKLLNNLWGSFSSDISIGGNLTSKVEKTIDGYIRTINAGNIFQEKIFRNAVFQANLKQNLRNVGINLEEIIAQNAIRKIPKDVLEKSVSKALELTFAKSPESKIAKSIIKFVNDIPGLTLAFPFPRFMMNSLKFFYDFSPFGALKLYSPNQIVKIANGDTKVISRAIIGSAMLGTAFQIRDSKWAGEKWYELKMENGKRIDVRPFNPFAAYLFVADIVKRGAEGRIHQLSTFDILQGLLSTNIRAGTGLFLVDNLLQAFAGLNKNDKFTEKIAEFSGQVAGGFVTPLQNLTDIYKQFNTEARIVRDTRQEPFFGPIKARIPGMLETLPPLELATREQPFETQQPVLKQLIGLQIREPSNPVEAEIDRLGFSYRELYPTIGNAKADSLIKKHLGRLVEQIIVPFVLNKGYKDLPDAQKSYFLKQKFQELRARARQLANADNPSLFARLKKEQTSQIKKQYLQSLGQF